MKILSIVNVNDAPPGEIGVPIEARGGECVLFNPHEGGVIPGDCSDFDGILILGGPMSAADPGFDPVFEPLCALVRDFHENRKPVLGICLGAQLVARAFGGTVRQHRQLQYGFKPLRITASGRDDPLLRSLADEQRIFVHHEDTFDVPEGAQVLMTEEDTPGHTFRIGEATYAFQSHPESTRKIMADWHARTQDGVLEKLGDHGQKLIDAMDEETDRYLSGAQQFAHTVGDRWMTLVENRRARAS